MLIKLRLSAYVDYVSALLDAFGDTEEGTVDRDYWYDPLRLRRFIRIHVQDVQNLDVDVVLSLSQVTPLLQERSTQRELCNSPLLVKFKPTQRSKPAD